MKEKCKINGFKYPSSDKIKGRISTIRRSMACTILNRKACSIDDEEKWKKFFPEKKCAYCGGEAKHLDHLYALIEERKPTGYETEPANLVPCCKDCNQPKGNTNWKDYMLSSKCNHKDSFVNDRIKTIENFQDEMPATKRELNDDIIKKWETILNGFEEQLEKANEELDAIKNEIYKSKT